MSPEIQSADPRLRIRLLVLLALAAALGAAGILYLDSYLTELHTLVLREPGEAVAKTRRAVLALLALVATGGVLFSLYLGRISWRTLSSERYPPPGTRVINDTRIHHGRQARRRGQAGLALSALTILLTFMVMLRAHRAFDRLLFPVLKPIQVEVSP